MTTEFTVRQAPREVLEAARAFFLGPESFYPAWLEEESDTHLSLGTFRGDLAVAAFADPEEEGATRVRISTLRDEGAVPRLVTYLQSLGRRAVPAAGGGTDG